MQRSKELCRKLCRSLWRVCHPPRSEGHAACRRTQRKPDTPTQVGDTPRAFSKGRMGLQEKVLTQKMATTQQARWARGCALPNRAPLRSDLVRCASRPCPPQACATGEKLKCAQHKPPEQADPLQVRNPSRATAIIYLSTDLSTCLSNYLTI